MSWLAGAGSGRKCKLTLCVTATPVCSSGGEEGGRVVCRAPNQTWTPVHLTSTTVHDDLFASQVTRDYTLHQLFGPVQMPRRPMTSPWPRSAGSVELMATFDFLIRHHYPGQNQFLYFL